ncbi:hypothetical protein [Robiginitalea sp.]|uniref:hypothetical protein n=1 Tax=Robiginitalea sp. TaxID=1902411 RepID=UPI003C70A8B1
MLVTLLKYKFSASLFFGSLVLIHVLWEYFHGGVTSHHLLASEEMPAISNWWGLLSVPVLTWITLTRIEVRRKNSSLQAGEFSAQVFRGFFGGLLYGLFLAMLWEFGKADYMPYVLLLPLVLALVFPVYRAECLLGFVLGMTHTFGGVLPFLIAPLLLLGGLIIYKGVRMIYSTLKK